MAKKISFNLSQKSINQAIKEIQDYKRELNTKCKLFCQKLSDRGIQVAKGNTGPYGNYIVFHTETKDTSNGVKAVLVASNTGMVTQSWKQADGSVKSVDVSPILMSEFGSGWQASNPHNVVGVGQGTFPDQAHAFDSEWKWQDLNGVWHTSSGEYAYAPIHHAYVEMYTNISNVAREVFGG